MLMGVAAAAGMVEGVARMASPWPEPDAIRRTSLSNVLLQHHQALVHAPRPSVSATIWDPEFQSHVRFNSFGVRGGNPQPLGANGRRVLFLGDSFTLAMQVNEEDTFTELVAAELSKDLLTQAWNAGVDDYGTWQAQGRAEELMERGLRFDAVVLMFYMGNDLIDNLRKRQARHTKPAAARGKGRPMSAPRSIAAAWTSLVVSQWQRQHDREHRKRLAQEVELWCDDSALAMIAPETRRSIADLARLARNASMPLVVALAPPQTVVHPEQGAALAAALSLTDFQPDRVTTVLKDLMPRNVVVVDLTDPLQAAAQDKALFLRHDGHWNTDGHRAVADALVPALRKTLSRGD